ncbi:hypothetical protein [Streptomyces sp. NBC_00690]|uniref:hypothetical protein n=1 Tax=Streptomyces sp. NBC_00690 TaxID=2975808 RepID=UPI002E2A2AC0|nr:hypothetical protein [Streptomyces sp. NBC_00690]
MKFSLTLRTPYLAAAGGLVAVLALTACTQSPAGHDDRLTKAAGIARVSLIVPKDLWTETKPVGSGKNAFKAKMAELADGPRAGRGLVRVTMSGAGMVSYLKELDSNAHPSKLNGTRDNTAASRRVYDALAPAVDRIKAATNADDPEPEVVIDDTIPDKN